MFLALFLVPRPPSPSPRPLLPTCYLCEHERAIKPPVAALSPAPVFVLAVLLPLAAGVGYSSRMLGASPKSVWLLHVVAQLCVFYVKGS